MIEVVVTAGAIGRAKLQSDHHQQTNSLFLQAGCPSCCPTNSVKGKISHPMDLLTPNSPGVFQLCLWPLVARGYLGEVCHASHQPCDASTPNESLLLLELKDTGNGHNVGHYATLLVIVTVPPSIALPCLWMSIVSLSAEHCSNRVPLHSLEN